MPDTTPTSPAADRNLLFGVLALQMDFIDRDALVQAMNAWVLDKHKPLGQILVAQHALAADEQAVLEALVQKHLQRHSNDPEKSLSAVASLGPLRHALELVADSDLHASLAHVPARGGEADPSLTCDFAVGMPTSSGQRFRVLRPHARGGLGEVFVARDEELDREVALKEIQPEHADRAEHRSRFLLEAKVTGGLEHPGIVPVYGLGAYPDGRPFYAMRLIRGDSLKEAVERFHKADVPGRDVGERTLSLRGLLGRFVGVCNAIAYAHSRGVLHRDLKPANVMLGPYGETLVVDWGLAKAVGRAEGISTAAEETLRPSSADGVTPTVLGQVVGTPAYMSPEQAAGRLDKMGPESDIYSLGATLYCLLTGRAPIEGSTAGEVLRQVQKGSFAPPRQVKPSVPAALEAICLKAMALQPEDRYSTARALADDIEHYLADEPVAAYREPWRVRSGRWVRRHKPAVAASAAVVVLLLLGGGAFAWWRNAQVQAGRERDARNAEAVAALLGQGEEALKASDAAKAQVALEAARKRSAEGGAQEQARRLGRLDADLALLRDLDAVDQFRWTVVVTKRPDPAVVVRRTRAALRRFGADPEAASVDAAAARVPASAVLERIVTALDRLLRQEKAAEVRAVLRRVDADPYRDAVRDAVLGDDRAKVVELAGQKAALEQPPGFVAFLGEYEEIPVARRRQLLEAAVSRRPGDLGLLMTLGSTYPIDQQDGANERLRWYQAAVAAAPDKVAALNGLGVALSDKGQVDEAIACFQKAIVLDTKFAYAHHNLGVARWRKGQADEAIACFRNAIALDPKDAYAHDGLGVARWHKGQVDEAIACFHKAIALDPKHAEAHSNLGVALSGKGQQDEAIACFQKAIALEPKHATAHTNLGSVLASQGRFAESLAAYKRGHELGTKQLGWPYPSAEWVRQAEAKAALEAKLPAFLAGEFRPGDSKERLGLAAVCEGKKLRHAATGLYAAAFAADPKLADDLNASHRYNAACNAALAAAGQGQDGAQLDDKEQRRLRQQARDWLRADLNSWAKQIQTGPARTQAAVGQLRHWQEDADLISLRDPAALEKLPEAERAECKRLWAEVAALLKKAVENGKK
jgi:tetratricopeptide (TPR) repeat protein/tRNA A-37 threonylcarbamoyl transferase component Bud32